MEPEYNVFKTESDTSIAVLFDRFATQRALSTTVHGHRTPRSVIAKGGQESADDTIAWYINDGDQGFTERLVSTDADGAAIAVDIDGDGDLDVLQKHSQGASWYENLGSEGFTTAHWIGGLTGLSVVAADLDGDGDLDFVADDGWYQNNVNVAPTAHIGSSSLGADTCGSIALDAIGSSDANGNIVSYDWDLDDDGDFDDATGKWIRHKIFEDGQFPIALRVTDSLGLVDTAVVTWTCEIPASPNPVVAQVNINTDRNYGNVPDLPIGPQPQSNWTQQKSTLRSIQVIFSEPVNNVTPADLILTNLGVNIEVDPDVVIPLRQDQIQTDGNVVTISFHQSEFPDGVLDMEVLTTVTAKDDDHPLDITPAWSKHHFVGNRDEGFQLTGDFDGDGVVSEADMEFLDYWFGQPIPTAPEFLDYLGWGFIGVFHVNELPSRLGNQILFEKGPLSVVGITVNTGVSDPGGLNGTSPPTTIEKQRSDILSLQVTFSEPIQTPSLDDLVLINHGIGGGENTVEDLTDVEIAQEGNVLTLLFAPNTLEDGSFSLRLSSVTDLTGNPLVGNQPDGSYLIEANEENDFYKLTGDWNGDSGVTIFDFPTFSYWFGQEVPPAPEYVNLDGDGGVSIFDFPKFAANFGVGVTFPATLVSQRSVEVALPIASRSEPNRQENKPSRVLEHPLDRQVALANFARAEHRTTVGESKILRPDDEPVDLEEVLDEIGADIFSAWSRL